MENQKPCLTFDDGKGNSPVRKQFSEFLSRACGDEFEAQRATNAAGNPKSSVALTDALRLTVARDNLEAPLRVSNAETITNILHRLFAKVEMHAPREVHGYVLGQSWVSLDLGRFPSHGGTLALHVCVGEREA